MQSEWGTDNGDGACEHENGGSKPTPYKVRN